MAVQWPLLFFSILIGISGSIMVFIGIGELMGKFKELRFTPAIIALVLLVIGGCISALHLGHPERALHILGNTTSGLSRELFAVGGLAVATFVYAILVKKEFAKPAKVFAVIAMILGIALPFIAGASYIMPSRPAWDSVTLPLMYLGTGLGLGFLMMAALACRKCSEEDAKQAMFFALIAVTIAVIAMIAYIVWLAVAPWPAADRDIARLISGDLGLYFWLGVVILGIVVPLVCAVIAWKQSDDINRCAAMLWAAFACSALGGVAIRVIMYLMASSVEQFFE